MVEPDGIVDAHVRALGTFVEDWDRLGMTVNVIGGSGRHEVCSDPQYALGTGDLWRLTVTMAGPGGGRSRWRVVDRFLGKPRIGIEFRFELGSALPVGG